LFRAGALNGRAVLEFNGINSLLKTYSASFSLPQPTTFFVVYRSLDVDSATVRGFVFDSRNSSVRQVFGRPGSGSIRLYANSDLDSLGITYPFPNFEIWSGTFNRATSSAYRNGTRIALGQAG